MANPTDKEVCEILGWAPVTAVLCSDSHRHIANSVVEAREFVRDHPEYQVEYIYPAVTTDAMLAIKAMEEFDSVLCDYINKRWYIVIFQNHHAYRGIDPSFPMAFCKAIRAVEK